MEHHPAEGLLRLTLVTQKIARHLATQAGLTVNEFHCMMQLHLEKPCCVRNLTGILGIGATSTSKLLRSLDNKGWITRELDPDDRRMERIAITPSGNCAVESIMRSAEAIAMSMIENLPSERREPFLQCIHNVSRHFNTIPHNQ